MPNWSVGTMKVRGSKENLFNFVRNAFCSVSYLGDDQEQEVIEGEDSITLKSHGRHFSFHVEGTRRNFVDTVDFVIWDEGEKMHILVLERYRGAWCIEVEPLRELSKKYNVDFKIYAYERGMEFNQDIEIVNGEIIKNETIKFEDYEWECIEPYVGG